LQLRVRHIARNVLFNWFGTVANTAVGFFLSPFILHRLGDVAYGVWVLTVSVMGYLSLWDLGMQSSVIRFVSQGRTKKDHEGASEVASAALWVRLQISAVALLLSAGLAVLFPHLFKVPVVLASDARKAILLIGATTAITMSLGVFGGVITALNRYDLQNYVGLVQTAIRVIAVIVVLRSGHGIVAIAACELVASIVGRLLLVWVARRIYPELRIRLNSPDRETLRKIWSYSSYTFITTVAIQLVYQTDNIVVGVFVSASAVTFYAIANSLCRYAGQVVMAMDSTFKPAASTYEASGDTAGLLMLYKNGTRAMLMVTLPIIITLIFRGSTFIGLWMGPQYSQSSGTVLIILTVPLFFSFANRTAQAISFGVEMHKTPAFWEIGEGIVNLILSIILARRYGIYGVAIGTMIPNLFVNLVFWPRYTPKMVDLSSSEIILRVWAPIILASVPYAVTSYFVESHFPAHSLLVFCLQVIATLPVFLFTVALIFRSFVLSQIMPKVRALLLVESR
jgi:O-antigen/teichoic acid export membrane protein